MEIRWKRTCKVKWKRFRVKGWVGTGDIEGQPGLIKDQHAQRKVLIRTHPREPEGHAGFEAKH